jgi:hypothetical protein
MDTRIAKLKTVEQVMKTPISIALPNGDTLDLGESRLVDFRRPVGAVYIFDNHIAQRVKVGMTISSIPPRLDDVNDMWQLRKVRCQICGGHLVNVGGRVPQHVVSGIRCSGGNAPPLEKDIALAESYLMTLKGRYAELSRSEKGSATRMIKTLEGRIEQYRHYELPLGVWQFRTAYKTECVDQVESLSHEILAEHLDKKAPFGEVFRCSVPEATDAVEKALSQLGLLHSAKLISAEMCVWSK